MQKSPIHISALFGILRTVARLTNELDFLIEKNMNKTRHVSIVVLNWNGLEDTVDCLKSLLNIDYSEYDIVVVDNSSDGRDIAILEEKFGAKIRLIKNDRNLGFAEGSNTALREILEEGKSEYVLLLNNDTVVPKDFLTTMVVTFSLDEKIGIIGNKILNVDGHLWSSGIKYLGDLFFINKFVYKSGIVDEVVGCCILVKQEVFNKVGLLDDLLFAYGEETDFCMRARESGYRIYYEEASHVIHKISRSTSAQSGIKSYLLVRNKIILGRRYYSGFRLFVFYIYIFIYVNYNIFKKFAEIQYILRGVRDGHTKNLDIR